VDVYLPTVFVAAAAAVVARWKGGPDSVFRLAVVGAVLFATRSAGRSANPAPS